MKKAFKFIIPALIFLGGCDYLSIQKEKEISVDKNKIVKIAPETIIDHQNYHVNAGYFNHDKKIDVLIGGLKKNSIDYSVSNNLGKDNFLDPKRIGSVYLERPGDIITNVVDVNKDSLSDILCKTYVDFDSIIHLRIYDFINQGDGTFKKGLFYETLLE